MENSQSDALLLNSKSSSDVDTLQRIQSYMTTMLPLADPDTGFLAGA